MADFTVNLSAYTAAFDGKVRGTDPTGVYVVDLPANSIFVDNTLGANITDGSYSIANRNGTGSDGDAYTTIQAAINAVTVGWTILLRNGTYTEIAIDIPEIKNGTAWTEGNYTTLKSYPGEWAKVDGTGLNSANPWYQQNIFTHPTSDNPGQDIDYNEYWLFSNFEVTGGRSGFYLKMRHVRFRHVYVHDNGRLWVDPGYDSLIGGIVTVCPQYLDIKYCWFKDNIQTNTVNGNNSNILVINDYKDDTGGAGSAWVALASTHHNEIAYNYFDGSRSSLHYKNQQRFGLNNRNPNDFTYEDYGDKVHHNIVLNAGDSSISSDQDFCQVYNNITDDGILLSRPGQSPIVYNQCAYNNSVKQGGSTLTFGAIVTNSGYYATDVNYYDVAAQKTLHEHIYIYNNITDQAAGYGDIVLRSTDDYEVSGNPDFDESDTYVDRNLSHNSTTFFCSISPEGTTPLVGPDLSVSQANSRIDTALSLTPGTTKNWDNDTAGLWVDTVGADQYKAVGTYDIDGTYTIADGGITAHPYLAGVTLPSYVGAADPADGAWVDGVHDDVPTVAWLTAQTTDPSWIE